jgi:hypothetical protein
MTAEEYFKTSNGNWFDFISQGEYDMLIEMLRAFAHLKCKEIEKYYDTELEMLYEDDIISEKIFLQIKGNSPEPET